MIWFCKFIKHHIYWVGCGRNKVGDDLQGCFHCNQMSQDLWWSYWTSNSLNSALSSKMAYLLTNPRQSSLSGAHNRFQTFELRLTLQLQSLHQYCARIIFPLCKLIHCARKLHHSSQTDLLETNHLQKLLTINKKIVSDGIYNSDTGKLILSSAIYLRSLCHVCGSDEFSVQTNIKSLEHGQIFDRDIV